MKLLFLFLSCSSLLAQNYAVKFWSSEDSSSFEVTNGISLSLPSQIVALDDKLVLPGIDYQFFTKVDLDAYMSSHAKELSDWKAKVSLLQASLDQSQKTKTLTIEQELQNGIDLLNNSYTNWNTLSPAQKDTALRTSIRVQLILIQNK